MDSAEDESAPDEDDSPCTTARQSKRVPKSGEHGKNNRIK